MSGMTTRWGWLFGIAMGSAIAFSANCAIAQITPDKTLPNNSTVTRDGNTHIIEGGTRARGNLFHSFQQFSVPTGSEAHFNNATGVQNIFGRVTGGSVSNIDGLIRANGTANLFLINPSGIIFGRNASLNIGGSFVATTANAIGFGEQGFFSASTPNNPELLTVNPSALLFNQIAAPIKNNSLAPAGIDPSGRFPVFGLRVSDGQSLLLVGGDININSGGLFAFGGLVELGGLAAPGTLGLSTDGNKLQLSFPVGVRRSDVSLTHTIVESSDVNIKAGKLLTDSAFFNAFFIGEEDSKNISVQADGSVSFKNSYIWANGNGNVSVQTNGSVSSKDSSIYAKNISVQANDSVSLASTDTNSINFYTTIMGTNDVQIQARSVSLTNGIVVEAGKLTVKADYIELNRSQLQGNDIKLHVRDLILMRERSLITTNKYKFNSGNIRIDAPHGFIIAIKNSDITANSVYGNGGNVIINATGIFGFKVFSRKDLIRYPSSLIETTFTEDNSTYVSTNVEQLNPTTVPTNDITAFAEQNTFADGIVNTNIFGVNPSQGLVQLPTNLVDVSQQIDTSCTPGSRQRASSFVVTGRGGLPPSPYDMLTTDAVDVGLVTLDRGSDNRKSPSVSTQPTTAIPKPIVEATGWVINSFGEVELTANAPTTPHGSWQKPVSCRASKHLEQL